MTDYDQYTEIFRRNPDARHRGIRANRVYHFDSWGDFQMRVNDIPQDNIPGFPGHGTWITNPFYDGSAVEVDPMEHYGFWMEVVNAGEIPHERLVMRDEEGRWHYLTDALGTGLPTGPRDWALYSPGGGRFVQTYEAFHVIVPEEHNRCARCDESDGEDDGLHEYRVIWGDRRFADQMLCTSCFAYYDDQTHEHPDDRAEGLPLAVIATAAYERALDAISIEAYNWTQGVAAIQDALGQDDGGLASLWWDAHMEAEWANGTYSQRRGLLHDYTMAEIQNRDDTIRESADAAERSLRSVEDEVLAQSVEAAHYLKDRAGPYLMEVGDMESGTVVAKLADVVLSQLDNARDRLA